MLSNWKKPSLLMAAVVMSAGLTYSTALAVGPVSYRTPVKSTTGVVHLTYWNMWSGIWTQVVQKLVDAFNKTHPDIQVKMLSVPSASGDQKLLTAIAAGDPPDVFTEWNPVVAAFAQQHALTNLNQFMVGPYVGLKHFFYPVSAQWGEYKGTMYAMPWMMNSFLLYYNKAIMKQAGLNPNDPPKTIAQLWADQSKEWKFGKGGVVKQIGFYPSGNWEEFMPMFGLSASDLFHGGRFDMTNPKAIALTNFFAKFNKYPSAQVSAFETGLSGAGGGSEDPFELGKAGFYINGMWEIPTIQKFNPQLQYGAVPIPIAPGGYYNTTWVNGGYNEIPSGAKYPQQAFEFISWLTGYHNAAWAAQAYTTGGWIPSAPAVTKQPAYQKYLNADPLRKPFAAAFFSPHDTITPSTPVDMFYEQKLSNMQEYVLQGKKTPLAALQHLEQVVNQQLQQIR